MAGLSDDAVNALDGQPKQNGVQAIRSATATRTMNELPLELVISFFADSTLVVLSQLGRIGSITRVDPPAIASHIVRSDSTVYPSLPVPPPNLNTSTIFGSSQNDEMKSYQDMLAAQIATIVWTRSPPASGRQSIPVMVGFGLTDIEGENEAQRRLFEAIVEMLNEVL